MSILPKSKGEKEVKAQVEAARELSARWRRYIESCKDERPLWEAQVAVCEHFASGNHRVSVSKEGAFKENPVASGEVWRTINLWPIALSVITSRLTANDPRWNPMKTQLSDVSDAEIEAADAALQYMWNGSGDSERSIKREVKRAIPSAYKQGRHLLYMRFDPELDMPVLDSFSLWNVYSDPSSNDLKTKRWLCIILPKHIDWLKDMYPKAKGLDLQTDSRLAESRMQEQFLRSKTGAAREDKKTVNTLYGFRLAKEEYDADVWETFEEENLATGDIETKRRKKGTEKKMRTVIIHEVIVESLGEGSPILHRETLEYDSLADIFDSFSPPDEELWHARPPCIDWVDPSKTINSAFSSIEAYIDMFGQGKWIITRKGLQIPVGGRHGQKIYAQPGEIVQMPMHPLPATHFTQLQNGITQFQQISGVHGVTLGQMPSGETSGKALAQASALDEQNSANDVQNFQATLERVAVKMLRIMAENWDQVHTIYRYDRPTGESKAIKVIGEKFAGSAEEENVTMIRPFKRVDVEIVVGPFFKSIHKQEMLMQVLNAGWEPGMNPVKDRVILDTIDIGVGREIVKELKKLRNPQLMIAEGKALLLQEGEEVPIAQSDPHEFLKEFYAGRAQKALENGDEKTAQIFNQQAQRHSIFIQQGLGGIGTPDAPETAEELMIDSPLSQGNAQPELPPELGQAAEMMPGGPPPIPGMMQ
jgi:hypothetical protein